MDFLSGKGLFFHTSIVQDRTEQITVTKWVFFEFYILLYNFFYFIFFFFFYIGEKKKTSNSMKLKNLEAASCFLIADSFLHYS